MNASGQPTMRSVTFVRTLGRGIMVEAVSEKEEALAQRAQVFCTICKKSMAVEVPVPEFCDCPHCGAHFPAGSEQAPKTPDPTHITKGPEPRTSEFRQKSIPDAPLPSPRSEEIRTLPEKGPFSPGDKKENKKNRRALFLVAGFIIVALGSYAGGALTRNGDTSDEAPDAEDSANSSEDGATTAANCAPQPALVANTGNFQGAKLRAKPGFDQPQASIISKGSNITVCERAETPGTKIPNVWYRLNEGPHKGLWIHGNTLQLK